MPKGGAIAAWQEPVGAALGPQTFVGQTITSRMHRWQIGLQRELPGRVTVEASYVGNHGTQLQTTRNLNATPLRYLSTSPVRDDATINYLSGAVPNPFYGLIPSTAIPVLQSKNIARDRRLRPFPEFDAVNTTTNEGWS